MYSRSQHNQNKMKQRGHWVSAWGGALALWLAGTGTAYAQDAATIKRPTQLRAAPGDSAASVAELAAHASVTRTSQRQGAWVQVRSESGATGWVHMFDIGTPARDNTAVQALRNLGNQASSGSSVSVATATVGIRGLGEGDVSRSPVGGRKAPNTELLNHADRLRASADSARAFASTAALQTRTVEALAVPALPPSIPASSAEAAATAPPQAGVAGDPALARMLQSIESMTDAQEADIGRQMAALLLQGKPLDPTAELQRYVSFLGRWLSLQSSRPDLPWIFVIVDESDFNAYSAPGGHVFVTRGLVDRSTDEAELAGLLAHEIAHVAQRHHLHAMRAALRVGAPAALPALVRQVHTQGVGAEAEHAADREAVTLAARAGLDPYGLVSALVQLNALGDSDLQFADAHPQSRLRLDHLEQAMARRFDPLVGTKAPVTVDARLEMAGIK